MKLSRLIVNNKKLILTIGLILLIPAALGYLYTGVNYDLISYFPPGLPSVEGENLLKEKFGMSGFALVMTTGHEIFEVLELKDRITAVDGVKEVSWLDDYTDVHVPAEFIMESVQEQFLSGDSALLQVKFVENARSQRTAAAIKEIRSLIGDDAYLGGEPVFATEMEEAAGRELVLYTLIAVVSLFVVLSLSMTSFLEPVLLLVGVGIAVVYNMGTNFIFGQISFMTASIAAVMQLGVSMDYSIFLLHRFEEEKLTWNDPRKAMVSAITKTAGSISASAITTVAGFAALIFMKNGIGRDMGQVLAKGVLISLIVNLTVLPCLVLKFQKTADRFRHRLLLPSFDRLAPRLIKCRSIFLLAIIPLAIISFQARQKLDTYYSNESYLSEETPAMVAVNNIRDTFGSADLFYIITPDEGVEKEQEMVAVLKDTAGVENVLALSSEAGVGIPEFIVPQEVREQMVSDGYRSIMVMLNTGSSDSPEAMAVLNMVESEASRIFDSYHLAGSAPVVKDMISLEEYDNRIVSLISIGAIALVLLINFKSLSLPILLILAIQVAIWINMSIPYFQGVPQSSLTPIIIGAIQLGATVDYAILFTSRYLENRHRLKNNLQIAEQTIRDTGRSILTSALTLFAATMGIGFLPSSIKTTGEMTTLIGRGALISMAVIFFVLPGLLILFDPVIGFTTRGWRKKSADGKPLIGQRRFFS